VARRRGSADDGVPLVSGDLGRTAGLERGRADRPHVVGPRLSGGGARGRRGAGAPGPERADGAGGGRSRLGPGADGRDARVRHQRSDEAAFGRAVAEGRTDAGPRPCPEGRGEAARERVGFGCGDLGKPSLDVIAAKRGRAVHVPDRSHVRRRFGAAPDEIRAEASRRLERDGYEPMLKRSRRRLPSRPEHLTDKQAVKLSEWLKYAPRAARVLAPRRVPAGPGGQERVAVRGVPGRVRGPGRALRSRSEPMKQIARGIRPRRPLILNWFRAPGRVSAGAVEGLNNEVKLVTRGSDGFATAKVANLALLPDLGRLPGPRRTLGFC